jgi:hypothetical protein
MEKGYSMTSIFIKTCRKDFEWLKYCLRSINMYARDFAELVIVCDELDRRDLEYVNTDGAIVHFVPNHRNGYIHQQMIKLIADTFCSSEHILFVDSDCVFFAPFCPGDFTRDGKPILLKTRYGELGGGECWKPITEHYLGGTVEFEYMRRIPLIFDRRTLAELRIAYPALLCQLDTLRDRNFSEFNALGAFAEREHPERYTIIDTADEITPKFAEQFWSWGGITPEILAKIEAMLEC